MSAKSTKNKSESTPKNTASKDKSPKTDESKNIFNQDDFFIIPVNKKPFYSVKETDSSYEISFTLPGVKKDSLDITVENQILHLKASYKNTVENMEIIYEHFPNFINYEISLQLGKSINVEKTKSLLADGILKLTLEKTENSKKKKILVN